MKTLRLLLVAALGFAGTATAQHEHRQGAAAAAVQGDLRAGQERGSGAAREWTKFPLILAAGRGGERAAPLLRPVGIDAAELQVFAADGPADRRKVVVPVAPEGARVEPAAPKVGNYHWIVARSEKDGEVRVASTTWYFSNPGEAPTALLELPKHELAIGPAPLPREHGAYRESEMWTFLVRFNGAPLPDQPVTLETENGSRSRFVSDAGGRVAVLFPRDIKPAAESAGGARHDMGPRRAGFVLAAERDDGGRHYLTAFNYGYAPDADRGKSLGWGAAFGVLGMVAATPLLRRRPAARKEASNA
jgi:hypothetical protein